MAIQNFNPTKSTWSQVANKQAFDQMSTGTLNAATIPMLFDPIYGKLVEQISRTIYRKAAIMQKWGDIGVTNSTVEFPGMIREIYMMQRKGRNFGMDNGIRPNTMMNYEIVNDDIQVRYHSAQFRWIYPYTIFEQELKRFSGGGQSTITQLTEMKQVNGASARNMFMDNLRKKVMSMVSENVAFDYSIGGNIADYNTLTEEQAKIWLNTVDNLLFELSVGTAKYNTLGEYMQTPKKRLQMVIPYTWYNNIIRKAFPNMYNIFPFQNILPENLILIDTMGNDMLVDGSGNEILPTWDAQGMNLLNWDNTATTAPRNQLLQAMIYDKEIMSFEDNFITTLTSPQDVDLLCAAVRSHFWTKAWFTDMLPAINLVYDETLNSLDIFSSNMLVQDDLKVPVSKK